MSQYLGNMSAYAYAVEKGYTGTEEEFAELMASYADVGQTAVTAAQTATTKASEAATSATTATNKATEATTAATTATTKAGEASTSASTATSAKDTAVSASQTATIKATEATTAAASATSAATIATTAKDDAVSAKTAAQTAQTGAETAAASVQSSAAQIQINADDISELKEDFTQMESDGVVPSAEQILTDKGVTDCVPYHFRKTATDNADREELEIVGGSVAWNQLAPTYSKSKNGATAFTAGTTVTAGHKMLLSFRRDSNTAKSFVGIYTMADGTNSYISLSLTANGALSGATIRNVGVSGVSNGSTSNENGNVWIYQESTATVTNLMLIDLTAMFGPTIADNIYSLEQATAGAGVALFKSLFPKDYYPYNAGELLSVSGLSAHKTVGFNQWDEEWEVGGYAGSTGAAWDTNTRIRSKTTNYISVLPNTTYYVNMPSGTNMYLDVMFYNADKTFISNANPNAGTTFTTPSDARFMRFATDVNYGTTYKNDICINLSDPSRNGEYEPYQKHTYPLDSSLTLRGIPKLDAQNNLYYDGDTYESDGTVTRKYGVVDLGTLTWTYNSASQQFRAGLAVTPKLNTSSKTPNAICTKYIAHSYIGQSDGEFSVFYASVNGVNIMDSAYTDAATFKTAMSGVYLVYELATPTTETAEPYINPQICDPNGTEEFVSTGIVPVGHNTKYPDNLRMKLDNLPWNFASLIAPTESGFKATRNYTTGALLIVNNVLYKATANIANGGNITVGTNVNATTLAEVISALF